MHRKEETMSVSRRSFLVGAGSIITASLITDLTAYVGDTRQPLITKPAEHSKIIFYEQVEDHWRLNLGEPRFEIPEPQLLIDNLRWTVIVLLYFFCISFIYKHAPSVHKKWNLINPGSILATGLMLLMTVAFSWWVASFAQYNQIYGSISTVLIIMILIFVNSLFLLIGFELNVSIQSLLQRAEERKEEMIDPI